MLKINDTVFEVVIIHKNISNLYLRIKGNTLEVTCPGSMKKNDVLSFIASKEKWIMDHYQKAQTRAQHSLQNFSDTVYFKGKEHLLIVKAGRPFMKVEDGVVTISVKDRDFQKAIALFYKEGAHYLLKDIEALQEKYLAILEDYGYDLVPEYRFRMLKSAWGICYPKKNQIVINERLIHFDTHTLEAILWHELLHFILPNHSKRFHALLQHYFPDYKEVLSRLY